MKRILICLIALIISAGASFAATNTNWDSDAQLKRVNTIGQKILQANKLPSGITFKISEEDHINAYANIDKEIYVYKGLLQFVENDQELAAVISHEMGHIVNAHCSKQTLVNAASSIAANSNAVNNTKYATAVQTGQQLAMLKMSRNDEYEADITGTELMIKAGYDPKAMISVLNKICENSFDVLSTHPSGINRLMNIYDYLAYAYPDTVKTVYSTDSYKNAIVAINTKVDARNAKKNGQQKHDKNMKKLVEKRQKQQAKYARTTDPWTTSVNAVNSTMNAVNILQNLGK